MKRHFLLLGVLALLHNRPTPSCAQSFTPLQEEDFFSMSIEELLQVDVITASRGAESLQSTASAISVITRDDIARSGARVLPEVLRLIPGAQVNQIDANHWSVSIRGFGSRFANKLLVLVDGRSVYNPVFSGVYWDMLQYPLEQIQQIEVIRGPGGSMWGANAVNGIINIVTKSASDTQGTRIRLGTGNLEVATGFAEYGWSLSENSYARISATSSYIHGFDEAQNVDIQVSTPEAVAIGNDTRQGTLSFRLDNESSLESHMITSNFSFMQGNAQGSFPVIFTTVEPVIVNPAYTTLEAYNADLTYSGNFELGDSDALTLTTYFTREDRKDGENYVQERNTFSLDTAISTEVAEGNILRLGGAYRFVNDYSDSQDTLSGVFIEDNTRNMTFSSGFLYDEQNFFSDRIKLSAGLKVTHNPFSDFDLQPTARLGVKLTDQAFTWASVSRAARVPSRAEVDMEVVTSSLPVPGGGGSVINPLIVPSDEIQSETVISYEYGLRFSSKDHSLDLAMFYNTYDDLQRFRGDGVPFFNSAPNGPSLLTKVSARPEVSAVSYGGELVGLVQISDNLRVKLSYSYIEEDLDLPAVTPGNPVGYTYDLGMDHIAFATADYTILNNINFRGNVRYVDTLRLPPGGLGAQRRASSRIQYDIIAQYRSKNDFLVELSGINLAGDKREYTSSDGLSLNGIIEPTFLVRFTKEFS